MSYYIIQYMSNLFCPAKVFIAVCLCLPILATIWMLQWPPLTEDVGEGHDGLTGTGPQRAARILANGTRMAMAKLATTDTGFIGGDGCK